MAEWWTAFHFLRPWWLLSLLVPLILYGRYFRGLNNQSSWEKVCDPRLLNFLLIRGSSGQRKILSRLGLLGVLAGIIAAAGPSWEKIEIPSLAPENPVMLLLNLSSEMKSKDVTPNRLDRAKYKIKDLLEKIPGAQSGLAVYSREPFLISPISNDGKIIFNLLPAVTDEIMPINGDRPDRAIAMAVEKLQGGGFLRGEIVLLAPDAGQRFDQALEESRKARTAGFKVNVIAVNVHPSEKLKMLAEAGGGDYFNLSADDSDVNSLSRKITKQNGNLKESRNLQTVWLDYGYYLLVIPLLCCLYFFRRGILVLLFILTVHPAEAGFFLNPNQEALRDFQSEDYQRAAEKFSTPEWKASSYYRMGDYEDAYQYFAQGKDVRSLYNQGNALAKSGKIEEAIKKYEEVLKLEAEHEDAKFNLEYLKQQQQKQKQQQNPNNQNKKDQNQQQSPSSAQNQQQPENDKTKDQDNPSQSSEQQKENNSQQDDQKEENQQQNTPESTAEQSGEEKSEQAEREHHPQSGGAEAQNRNEPQPREGSLQKEGEAPKYDEEVQARAQQYREIPEEPGGLLKAMIRREYNRNRYDDK